MYIITVVDQATMTSKTIRDVFSDLGEYRIRMETERKAGNMDDTLSMPNFFTEDLEVAREMASLVVRSRPLLSAYISKQECLVMAEPPKPVFKTVNENGIVPEAGF